MNAQNKLLDLLQKIINQLKLKDYWKVLEDNHDDYEQ